MIEKPSFNVRYDLLSNIPNDLIVGETLTLDVAIANLGPAPLIPSHPNPVALAYHFFDAAGREVVYDGLRTALPDIVEAGARVQVEMRVATPPEPGTYRLEIELVAEGIAWFKELSVPPLSLTVRYAPRPGPVACILNGNVIINDAVGAAVVAQLRILRAAGYFPLILTEFVDARLPEDVRRSTVQLTLAELQHPTARTAHAVDLFHSADVVIVNYSTYYELAQAIKLAGKSAILWYYYGITPPELWTGDTRGQRDLALGQQHLSLVEHADYALTISQYARDELLRAGRITPDRVRVVPLGVVDEARYAGAPDPSLVQQYQLAGRRVLLYVGRMARNKRIEDLVEALAVVRQHHPETVLLLVGDNRLGPFRDYMLEVQQRAQALGCADYVIWTGQVPDVEPFYGLCDLFVTASVHEAQCIPVIEAMARGKPVVAAAATAIPETIGMAGVLFEPRNPGDLATKIVDLLNDLPSLDQKPGENYVAKTAGDLEAYEPPTPRETRPIALVAPRYGPEILGGAERMIRGWAEQLASHGYRTEVLTTCTLSMSDWSNYYTPGTEQINDITVHRFPTDRVDSGMFHAVLAKANRGEHISYEEELEFVHNNLGSAALTQYLRDHREEWAGVIFGPYLFGTTYWGMQALPDKAILLPCLHDEASAKFVVFREMLEAGAGIFFNARAEHDFATETLKVANPNRRVVGYGFDVDAPAGDGAAFRARHHLPDTVLLYSGRLEFGKNVPLLLDYFVRFKTENPGSLTLVLAGTGDVPIPKRPDIVELGFLSDELSDAYAASVALCQPSLNESFSIVIMESWLQRRPVLVHADCAVTRDHVEASGGGYAFGDYPQFRTALQRLLADPSHAAELGQRGQDYVRQNYSWEQVTERFLEGVRAFIALRSRYGRLAQDGIQRALAFTHTRFRDTFLHIIEEAQTELTGRLNLQQAVELRQMAQIGRSGYRIQSRTPVIGPVVSWLRKQLTSHLREPYLDPIVEQQQAFNNELVNTLLPALEQSLREQRRLRREVENLREQLRRESNENKQQNNVQHPK